MLLVVRRSVVKARTVAANQVWHRCGPEYLKDSLRSPSSNAVSTQTTSLYLWTVLGNRAARPAE